MRGGRRSRGNEALRGAASGGGELRPPPAPSLPRGAMEATSPRLLLAAELQWPSSGGGQEPPRRGRTRQRPRRARARGSGRDERAGRRPRLPCLAGEPRVPCSRSARGGGGGRDGGGALSSSALGPCSANGRRRTGSSSAASPSSSASSPRWRPSSAAPSSPLPCSRGRPPPTLAAAVGGGAGRRAPRRLPRPRTAPCSSSPLRARGTAVGRRAQRALWELELAAAMAPAAPSSSLLPPSPSPPSSPTVGAMARGLQAPRHVGASSFFSKLARFSAWSLILNNTDPFTYVHMTGCFCAKSKHKTG